MGYHHCPIEPDDWANGPNEPEGEECYTCEGAGEITDDGPKRTCPDCDGTGTRPYEPYEGDYQWGD